MPGAVFPEMAEHYATVQQMNGMAAGAETADAGAQASYGMADAGDQTDADLMPPPVQFNVHIPTMPMTTEPVQEPDEPMPEVPTVVEPEESEESMPEVSTEEPTNAAPVPDEGMSSSASSQKTIAEPDEPEEPMPLPAATSHTASQTEISANMHPPSTSNMSAQTQPYPNEVQMQHIHSGEDANISMRVNHDGRVLFLNPLTNRYNLVDNNLELFYRLTGQDELVEEAKRIKRPRADRPPRAPRRARAQAAPRRAPTFLPQANEFVDEYAALELNHHVPITRRQLTKKVRALQRRFHPDSPGGGNLERSKAINAANDVLQAKFDSLRATR
jgi:hypothetical protein